MSWSDLTDGIGDLRDLIDDRHPSDAAAVSIGELIDANPTLQPVPIDGLLRRGEIASVTTDPKRSKSWLTDYVLLCIAIARELFRRFATRETGRVLLIDNELHTSTIAHRIPTVASVMGIRADQYRDRVDVISPRGRLTDYYGVERLPWRAEARRYATIWSTLVVRWLWWSGAVSRQLMPQPSCRTKLESQQRN